MKFKISVLILAIIFINKVNAKENFFEPQIFQASLSHPPKHKDVVYVCMGDYAQKYHSRSNCTGLNNCRGTLYYMDSYTATYTYNRTPCCVCYNCKGAGGGGGGGDNDAIGYAVLVIAVASAAILSNDIYAYPVFSFKKQSNNFDSKRASFGWAMGFRKTFKNCALEYGASMFDASPQYNNWGYYQYPESNKSWGIHFNFVHKLFQNKTPDWLKVYAGPTVNLINEFGYGGILGAEMKLIGRLKFDVRYELSSQTNQFQTGLIFNYQKKYLWQR